MNVLINAPSERKREAAKVQKLILSFLTHSHLPSLVQLSSDCVEYTSSLNVYSNLIIMEIPL